VELRGVTGYKNIQIHNGSYPKDFKGCFGVGNTSALDFLGGSKATLQSLLNLNQCGRLRPDNGERELNPLGLRFRPPQFQIFNTMINVISEPLQHSALPHLRVVYWPSRQSNSDK